MSETPPSSAPEPPFTPDEARTLLQMLEERYRATPGRWPIPSPRMRRVMEKLEKLSKQ